MCISWIASRKDFQDSGLSAKPCIGWVSYRIITAYITFLGHQRFECQEHLCCLCCSLRDRDSTRETPPRAGTPPSLASLLVDGTRLEDLESFEIYLVKQFCVENLFAYGALLKFESQKRQNAPYMTRLVAALRIYQRYIRNGAPNQVCENMCELLLRREPTFSNFGFGLWLKKAKGWRSFIISYRTTEALEFDDLEDTCISRSPNTLKLFSKKDTCFWDWDTRPQFMITHVFR